MIEERSRLNDLCPRVVGISTGFENRDLQTEIANSHEKIHPDQKYFNFVEKNADK